MGKTNWIHFAFDNYVPKHAPYPPHEHEHEHVDEPKHASPPTKSVKCLSMETPPRSVTMAMAVPTQRPTTWMISLDDI